MAGKRGAGGRSGTRAPGRPVETEGRRLTKAERKEQARLQRLELQRKMARSRRNRLIGIVVLIAISVGAIVFAIVRPRPEVLTPLTPRDLLARAATAAEAASCGEITNVGEYAPKAEDRIHVGGEGGPTEMPPVSSYPSVPPASGPHNPIPLPGGLYTSPPALDRVIHSLEHGAVVIWYDPSASGEKLDAIEEFFSRRGQRSHVIMAPYSYPAEGSAGVLPGGSQMALVAWHNVRTCGELSLPVAFDFVAHYRFPPFDGEEYLGEAPEQGRAI